MMGSSSPTGPLTEIFALLNALVDSEKARAAVKDLSSRTEALYKMREEVDVAKRLLDKETAESIDRLEKLTNDADVATQRESDATAKATQALSVLRSETDLAKRELKAREDALVAKTESLLAHEKMERDALSVRVSNVTAREREIGELHAKAKEDAASAAAAKEHFEGKLEDLSARVAALSALSSLAKIGP